LNHEASQSATARIGIVTGETATAAMKETASGIWMAAASSRGLFFAAALASLLLQFSLAWGQDVATLIPPPALDDPVAAGKLQKAVLAGGCYWGTQGVFVPVIHANEQRSC
jgi:hypothetical protein